MIRLTLILAMVIFAILVIVPQEQDPAQDGVPVEERPAALAPAARPDRGAGTGDALREGPGGQLVLRTTTGEDLPIDVVVEPLDQNPADAAAPTATATPEADGPAEPAGATETAAAPADGVTRLRVTGDRVNFRAGPSTEDEILAALELGTEVELIELVGDGWAHLRVPASGLTGYMSGDFLAPAN